jgi:hypothetical protein
MDNVIRTSRGNKMQREEFQASFQMYAVDTDRYSMLLGHDEDYSVMSEFDLQLELSISEKELEWLKM